MAKRKNTPSGLPEENPAGPAVLVPPGNGAGAQVPTQDPSEIMEFEEENPAEAGQPEEPPARMRVQIEGTAGAVRSAARKVGNSPIVRTSAVPAEEPPDEDPNLALLSDGQNMVLVTRQFPRTIQGPRGERIVCNTRVGGRFACPTSKSEIENHIFEQFGGLKYKCTIHRDTTNGENVILGYFTIEHPDSDAQPFIQGVTDMEPEHEVPMGGMDPTLRETDPLIKVRQDLERELDRARQRKEIKEIQRQIKQLEEDEKEEKTPVPSASVESEEIRKLREDNAKLQASLQEKKTDDRFTAMQNSIADLTKAVAVLTTRPVESNKSGEEGLVLKILSQSQQHSKDMIDILKTVNKPVVVPSSQEGGIDQAFNLLTKAKGLLGGGEESRSSQLEKRLLENALDRLENGEMAPPEEDDAIRLLIKEAAPILRTYVDKQVQKEEATGEKLTPERVKQIQEEAAMKAAKELAAQWQAEGVLVKIDPKTGKPHGLPAPQKKAVVPPRKNPEPVQKTEEGTVRTVKVEAADLSNPKKPQTSSQETPAQEGEEMVRFADLPGIGKVEVPAKPGEMKYDRKKSVNFILDSILSEIHREVPTKSPEESYVIGDALELLDDALLDDIWKATSGDELDKTLGAWGDRGKLDAIKLAGQQEAVDAWIRRVIRTIQDLWRDQKKAG